MKVNSTVNFMGYPVFTDNLKNLPESKKCLINTINQYSYCIAENDTAFKNALIKSEVLLPDGIAIVWAIRFLYGKKIKKIAGADLHEHLLKVANVQNLKCFYLGSSETTLKCIEDRLSIEYPNLKVGFYSPPYKPAFTKTDSDMMIKSVNDFNPDVVFLGMTAPKQEKWGFEHKHQLNARFICSIGAVFDFYAGTVRRPSKLWIDLGLEWFGRLLKEPRRMWKRYIYYGLIFVKIILGNRLKLTKNNKA